MCLADTDCFVNVFSPQESVNVALSYPVCSISVAVSRNVTFDFGISNVQTTDCLYYTTAPVYEEPFQPPFLYSYQCSSALITAYTPAFVLQYVFNGFILPLVELSSWFLIRRYLKLRKENSNYSPSDIIAERVCMIDKVRALTCGIVGNFYWPVAEVLLQKFTKRTSAGELYLDRSIVLERFAPSRNKIYTMIGAVAVALSFGILYPPLGFIMMTSICVNTYLVLYLFTRFLTMHTDKTIRMEYMKYLSETNAKSYKILYNTGKWVAWFTCTFYAFFLFDVLSAKKSFFTVVFIPISYYILIYYMFSDYFGIMESRILQYIQGCMNRIRWIIRSGEEEEDNVDNRKRSISGIILVDTPSIVPIPSLGTSNVMNTSHRKSLQKTQSEQEMVITRNSVIVINEKNDDTTE